MSIRPLALAALLAVAVAGAACAPTTGGGTYRAAPAAFNPEDFDWSARSGQASIEGRIAYQQNGQVFACAGSVGLTPDTPYTRARFRTLYGSIDSAALPVAVVRARTVPDPNADYRSFVRSEPCQDGRFRFTGLPDGSWFLIAPVSAGGDPIVLMRRVETRGGRMVAITL